MDTTTILTLFLFLCLTIQPIITDVGICSCDLTKNRCDASCCCDTDCSANDLQAFHCQSKAYEDVKSKPTVQSTCFKDIPIYKSNSPYVVQKKDNLICVNYERDINDSYYQQLINEKIASKAFSRSINTDNSVPSSIGTPSILTNYQLGTSIFRYYLASNTASHFSLPIKLFNGQTCSGSQPITYLNDFTSTCLQPVNNQTCLNALDTNQYISQFCLVPNPAALTNATLTPICCTLNGTGSSSSLAGSTCTNALQTLNIIIYYTNSIGIVNCSISLTTLTSSTTVQQTRTVRFVQASSTPSSIPRSGNPGYFNGAPILAGTSNGTYITISDFTISQASSDGSCSSTSHTIIRFGQNIQSTCLFGPSTSLSCPNITDPATIFKPYTSSNVYVAAIGNPDSTSISTNWLPVTYCTSEIGSSNPAVCQQGSIPSPSANECYNRLDIQIVYANIGSVTNPQSILGGVIFHYQRITRVNTTVLPAPLLFTHTVTFQDVSNPSVNEEGYASRPNANSIGDFFYPFSPSPATNAISFSLFVYLLISFLLISL